LPCAIDDALSEQFSLFSTNILSLTGQSRCIARPVRDDTLDISQRKVSSLRDFLNSPQGINMNVLRTKNSGIRTFSIDIQVLTDCFLNGTQACSMNGASKKELAKLNSTACNHFSSWGAFICTSIRILYALAIFESELTNALFRYLLVSLREAMKISGSIGEITLFSKSSVSKFFTISS
jgi:hypothetical protein